MSEHREGGIQTTPECNAAIVERLRRLEVPDSGTDLEWHFIVLYAALRIEEIEAQLATARAMNVRWNKTIAGVTPGGSEFYDSPERCAEFITQHLANAPACSWRQRLNSQRRIDWRRQWRCSCMHARLTW